MTNIPSPYRVDFFNELGKQTELTVIFEKKASGERNEQWHSYDFRNFKAVFLGGIATDTDKAFCPGIIHWLKIRDYDQIVITNVATPTGILALLYLKKNKMPYIIEGDGGIAKDGKGMKERAKRLLIGNAKAYFSTSAALDQYFLQYGAVEQTIYRYPFTSIRESDIVPQPVSPDEKKQIREDLGITCEKMIISVGRLIYRKGFDLFLEAGEEIDQTTGIYLIGAEVTDTYSKEVERKKTSQIQFVPHRSKEELALYYKAADLFVLPTREDIWGLVVNEAMSYGLPVVTTNRCIAGVELVTDSENGFLIPVEDPTAMADKINEILENDVLRQRMSEESLRRIHDYTIEKMAATHVNLLEELS